MGTFAGRGTQPVHDVGDVGDVRSCLQTFIEGYMCHGQKVAILGMVIPPLIGILIMGI